VSDMTNEYVDGDINTIDDNYDDANVDQVAQADVAVAVLTYVAKALADEPEAVSVSAKDSGNKVILSLQVGAGDMGRVIGRRGRTAQALRTIVGAAGSCDGVTATVDIVD